MMRSIQFGAEARFKIEASSGAPIPEPHVNVGPMQRVFRDIFKRQVAGIDLKTKILGDPKKGDGHEVVVDQQYATVVIDSKGARTEIETGHNGSRTVPWPEGWQNTVKNWKQYLYGIAADMQVREAQLLTKEERIEKSLKASAKLISTIAPALQNGKFKILGDPEAFFRLQEAERDYEPKPVALDIKIGEQTFNITRRHCHSRGSMWIYDISPKDQPGGSLQIEINTNPRNAGKSYPIWELIYRDEDNFQLDLKKYHRDLDEYEEPPFFGNDKTQQAFTVRKAKEKALVRAIWEQQLCPMGKALIAFDQKTRLYNRFHDR